MHIHWLRLGQFQDLKQGLDQLQAQRRLNATAERNANDGISFLAIADGALNEVGNILTRMSELATQAPYLALSLLR